MKSIFYNEPHQLVSCLLGIALLLAACNQPLDIQEKEYQISGISDKKGRLMLIVIDGASGHAVKNAINTSNAQNIRRMLDHSQYTFEGLADARSPLAYTPVERGWANLLTGVTTHGVGEDGEDITSLQKPSLLKMAKTGNDMIKTGLFASTAAFYRAFNADADVHSLNQDNDAAVAEAVMAEIAEDLPADIIIAQFGSVQLAGENGGFFETGVETTPTGNIITAVKQVDAYIGKIMAALQARNDYVNENWLVILTSSYGGEYPNQVTSSFFYDFPDRNTFTVMYNIRFQERMLLRPVGDDARRYQYTTAFFSGRNIETGATNAVMDDNTFFEIGQRRATSPSTGTDAYPRMDNNDYTIAFKLLNLRTGRCYASLLSKGNARNAAQGWRVQWVNTDVAFYYNGLQSVNNTDRISGSVLSTGSERESEGPRYTGWLSFHIVFKRHEPRDASDLNFIQYSDTAYFYMNGVLQEKKALNCFYATQYLENVIPAITIGDNNNDWDQANQEFILTDLQFYNIAMDEDFIAENYCQIKIDEIRDEWPYWDNLLAYFPNDRVDDIGLGFIRDYSQFASSSKNLYFNRMHSGWIPPFQNPATSSVKRSGESVSSNICPRPDDAFYKEVFNSVDIVYQSMQWLGIIIRSEWELEGLGWSIQYDFME